MYRLDPAGQSWTNLSLPMSGNPPSARCGHGFAAIGDAIYVFGGSCQTGLRLFPPTLTGPHALFQQSFQSIHLRPDTPPLLCTCPSHCLFLHRHLHFLRSSPYVLPSLNQLLNCQPTYSLKPSFLLAANLPSSHLSAYRII